MENTGGEESVRQSTFPTTIGIVELSVIPEISFFVMFLKVTLWKMNHINVNIVTNRSHKGVLLKET